MAKDVLDALRLIQEDARNDAMSLDGQPLSGRLVGTMFGNVFASIDALAKIIEEHLLAAERGTIK
jgi:hypothetical protein